MKASIGRVYTIDELRQEMYAQMKNPPELRGTRAAMVQKYLAHPSTWPDGIESCTNHWYTSNREYWGALSKKVDARGNWLDPMDDPMRTDPRLQGRAATKNATENKRATEKRATLNRAKEIVTVIEKKGRGRPKTGKALSATERSRKARAGKPATGVQDFKG